MKPDSMSIQRSSAGFTLVELVIVIAILGVLAAVALPRFTSLQGDARASKAQAMFGSIRAASAQTRAVSMTKGQSCSTAAVTAATSPVILEGLGVELAYCYPAATAVGIQRAANIDATNDNVTINTATAGTLIVQVNGAATPANCAATYVAPTAANGQPTFSVVVTGC